jgi:hypothetical protein
MLYEGRVTDTELKNIYTFAYTSLNLASVLPLAAIANLVPTLPHVRLGLREVAQSVTMLVCICLELLGTTHSVFNTSFKDQTESGIRLSTNACPPEHHAAVSAHRADQLQLSSLSGPNDMVHPTEST